MQDLSSIENTYKKLSNFELIRIALNPGDLRLEVIPVLQKELLSRGEQEEALKLSEYLVGNKNKEHISDADVREMVKQRLASGESLESIQLKLKENGLNVFEVLNEDAKLREQTFDYILALKEKGMEEQEIRKDLQEKFEMTEHESEMLKIQLKKKGKINLVVGYTLVIITLGFMMLAMAGGASIGVGAVILLGIGVWRIYEGHRIKSF